MNKSLPQLKGELTQAKKDLRKSFDEIVKIDRRIQEIEKLIVYLDP